MEHQSNSTEQKKDRNRSPWYRQIFLEVRTQILLCYLGLLALLMGITIPTVHQVIYRRIDLRSKIEVASEIQEFKEEYNFNPEQNITQQQKQLIAYLREDLVEQNQYIIVILNQGFFQSSPLISDLPPSLQPNSLFIQQLITQKNVKSGEFLIQDDQVGKIFYSATNFDSPGQSKGIFLVAYATRDGYRQAASAMKLIFTITASLLLVTSIGAWYLSGWILKPLRVMSTTVKQISERDLSQRLPVSGQGEMAEIANTFNAMMERVEQAFLTQKQFIQSASHELKTPITIIQGHFDLIDDDPVERQVTQEIINEELHRMTILIENLLILTKVKQPNFLQPKLIDIAIFTNELWHRANQVANNKIILKEVGNGQLHIDPQRLTQAMMNLIENAVQHTSSKDTIFIGSYSNELEVRFWVQDTGKGITNLDRKHIFNPFVRATNTYRNSNGFGLGLSVTKAIVNACGGTILLDSLPEKGSTFTLVFPLNQST